MTKAVIDKYVADCIWDVLVEFCGASDNEFDRFSFVNHACTNEWTEYRFGGVFSSGGKVWNNAGMFYVSYYREDETKERRAAMDKANLVLTEIHEEVFGC